VEKPTPVEQADALADMENDMASRKNAAVKAKKSPAAPSRGANVVAGVTISHPDKPLWPATKTSPAITKLDLARYYESVAPRMLPHIGCRPVSMVRAPDGMGGQRFFQRHVLAGVASFEPIKVAGEKQPYHSLDTVEGLVGLAQAAVLEIHPWGVKRDDPETPERLVFDLDPAPELPFDRIIDAAHEIRQVLQACGFEPFVKTTGGKGIHVVVAIKGAPKNPATWPEAKAFALSVAEYMTKNAPDRYVSNMSKKLRVGKIFVDYLRNDRTATAVAPWSPRAREGAPIAMPLPWKDVRKGLDPTRFSVAELRAVLKRADPWKDLAASAISLDAAIKKFAKL
jgi:bifunctional non-homologous end joining protein LigD